MLLVAQKEKNKMISAIIITYNEEEVLEDSLKSLSGFADEIIIIDSKSTDKTQPIAKKYKARVFEHELSSFAEQRNLGAKYAKGDFIFYLDADERLTEEFKKEALGTISAYNPLSHIAGYFIKRKTFYFGKDWGLTDSVQRLFYKKKLKEWYGIVHESPTVDGQFERINAPINHFTHRNMQQMIIKTNKWSKYEAELRIKAHHPRMTWWRFPRVMITEFLKSYVTQKGYKNGTYGLIESIYQSYSAFITYAKLWELQNRKT